MTVSNAEASGEEKSLAHLLEFLARLENKTEVKEKVIKEIRRKVEAYTSKELDTFATEDAESGYLPMTISKSTELRSNIVLSEGTYKHYTSQFRGVDDANKYTELLINNIFSLFGCSYYMYFECAGECNSIEGGNWWDERCDGKGTQGENLNQWLQDKTGTTGRMIQRGFKQDDLSDKKGECLFPSTKSGKAESEPLLDFSNGAQLQYCLFFILFLPEVWNTTQSGHAVLFLQAFCKMASEKKFNGQYTQADGESFKTACQEAQESIDKLTGLKIIVPVAWNEEVKYTDLLEPKHFWNYIKWLQGIFPKLIMSLTEMANDVDKWNKESLKKSTTLGPYPWGFTFSINWESSKSELKQKLNGSLQNLSSSLSGLKDALSSISKATSSSKKAAKESSTSTTSNTSTDSTASTASTLGSVIGGLGGLGATAGAAYAGSGFLGPVAEGVGKFFKGLIL